MPPKRFGVTLLELLAVLVIIAVTATILFPIFANADTRPTGVVQDGTGHPMSGATLRFRDAAGHILTTVTADSRGEFHLRGLSRLDRSHIDDFMQSRYIHSTGGSDHFYFSPIITQQATFQDTSGRPVPALAVLLRPKQLTWETAASPSELGIISDRLGTSEIRDIPATARFDIESRDRRYVVTDVKTVPAPRAVRYDVTVTAPAIITGRLLAPDGTPRRGFSVYGTIAANAGHGLRPDACSTVGPTGRFRITSLWPDQYYVSAQPLWRPRDILLARRVSVASGQTVNVELRPPGLSPPPARHAAARK